MKVEIWSDLVCPFCYIGKRNLEAALERFEHRDEVTVRWRSFQLDPDAPREPEGDLHDHLAAKYGGGRARAIEMNARVTETAASVGLRFDLDNAKRGNTLDAHRVVHLARDHGLEDAAEERLFAAYFTEAEPIADRATLVRLGASIGLDADELRSTLD